MRKAEGKDITVNINSGGGDFFAGLAIYNMLNEYEGNVKVRVLGMAASAASVIAMAGDDIEIGEEAFLMIHNAWTIAIGNKNGMQEVADMLSKFDESMKSLYAKKTGIEDKKIAKMMDDETWISGKEAIEMKFATALLGSDELDIEEEDTKAYNATLRKVDLALAKDGMSRTDRRALIKDLTGTPSATKDTPSAVELETIEVLKKLLNITS